MIEESEYCSDVMKKHFNKELMMTKENNENFKNSTKCCICDSDHVGNDVKLMKNVQALHIDIVISILN